MFFCPTVSIYLSHCMSLLHPLYVCSSVSLSAHYMSLCSTVSCVLCSSVWLTVHTHCTHSLPQFVPLSPAVCPSTCSIVCPSVLLYVSLAVPLYVTVPLYVRLSVPLLCSAHLGWPQEEARHRAGVLWRGALCETAPRPVSDYDSWFTVTHY